MNMKFALAILGAVVLLASLLFSIPAGHAAPMAAPTPVSVSRGDRTWFPATFFNAAPLATDTRSGCFETAGYDLLDIQTVIDQGTTNTVTLKLQFTNDEVTFVDGVSVVSANTEDASAMNQFQAFGRYTCLYADVANTNTVTITAKAIIK